MTGGGWEVSPPQDAGRCAGVAREVGSASAILRAEHFGTTSRNTCAPLSSWRGDDVFAYLHREGLPVHPAYACTLGGSLDRRRIRVATLGGQRGSGHGRTSWEKHYYPDEMIALGFASSTEVPRLLSDG